MWVRSVSWDTEKLLRLILYLSKINSRRNVVEVWNLLMNGKMRMKFLIFDIISHLSILCIVSTSYLCKIFLLFSHGKSDFSTTFILPLPEKYIKKSSEIFHSVSLCFEQFSTSSTSDCKHETFFLSLASIITSWEELNFWPSNRKNIVDQQKFNHSCLPGLDFKKRRSEWKEFSTNTHITPPLHKKESKLRKRARGGRNSSQMRFDFSDFHVSALRTPPPFQLFRNECQNLFSSLPTCNDLFKKLLDGFAAALSFFL